MKILELEPAEIKAVKSTAQRFLKEFSHLSQEEQIDRLYLFAYTLPERVVATVCDMKYRESTDALIIRGIPINDNDIGRTPPSWKEAPLETSEDEAILLLMTYLLGDVIAWSSQQWGRIVHNIVPVKGDEYKQIGSSTLDELWWHTEEAFHECRCDYLALLCLRNPTKVATLGASVNSLQLDESIKKELFESNFVIYPDDSHLDGKTVEDKEVERVSVLFGDLSNPYLRIDPYYMKCLPGNEMAKNALSVIVKEIDKNINRYVLEPGDLFVIDNYTMVHGREAFNAKYDGTDRWLKRVNITRDLRKSRKYRTSAEGRIINYTVPGTI
jgi:Fe(II)/alpha-ketoglutarate-dependent arginine beta-hydroxylase